MRSAESQGFEQISWQRSVPVRYEADVAVVGGGMAGVCAAAAAAASGASVILVERFAVTGGNFTVGGVGAFCGETAGQGQVFDEIIAGLDAFGGIAPYQPYPELSARVFDHELLAVVLQELLCRRGVRLLLHTRFVDVRADDGRITEAIVCGASGPEALRAKQFVDASGQGELAHRAGFATVKGRPEDEIQLPMSMMYFVREQDGTPQVPDGWFETIADEDQLPMTSIWPNGPGGRAIKVKVPLFDATDTESLAAAEIFARRRMMQVLDYHQRAAGKDFRFDHCSPTIGIREGRRVVGDYVLSVDDLRAGRRFDDGVARGTFYLDGHKPDDDKRTYILPKDELGVPPYQIPLRALRAAGGANLWMAGRCLSADQLALSSARVGTSCAMMGQAVGIAAALAARGGCSASDIDPADVRAEVIWRGAMLDV